MRKTSKHKISYSDAVFIMKDITECDINSKDCFVHTFHKAIQVFFFYKRIGSHYKTHETVVTYFLRPPNEKDKHYNAKKIIKLLSLDIEMDVIRKIYYYVSINIKSFRYREVNWEPMILKDFLSKDKY